MNQLSRKIKFVAILMILGFTAGAAHSGTGKENSSPPSKADPKQTIEQFWLNAYGGSSPADSPKKGEKIPAIPGIPGTPPGELPGDELFATLSRELLAKATPDECYNGIGNPYPPGPPCSQGKPKVNQAYVWGLAKSGSNIWVGTAPNVHCLAMGTYGGNPDPEPRETDSWVCEFGSSQYSRNYPYLPPAGGDWRPPHIYTYNTVARTLTEKSPQDPAFRAMHGIRSAGSLGNIVFMGGPNALGGITLCAFLSDSGTYLGSKNLPAYTNIRKWVVVDNVLYTAVRNATGQSKGSVLRWTGELAYLPSNLPDLARLFQFTVVGNLRDGEGAELAEHEGRLFVTTWPGNMLAGEEITTAGLYMSPPIPQGGLTARDADGWTKVWQVDDYEPDWVTAATYGGGALASFDGYLYWGTMHVPFTSALAHFTIYGMPDNPEDILTAVLATYRPISIFRGRNFNNNPRMQLVYGMPYLPKYVPPGDDPSSQAGHWEIVPTKMGPPIWGLSGFGNFFNNYTWTMSVYNNRLFIGTMDWSYFVGEQMSEFLDFTIGSVPDTLLQLPTHFFGADLYRIESSRTPAVPESLAGVGNYTSYGIRTMLADDALYLGMANPMNLLTDPDDDLPEGGWELIRLGGDFPVSVDIDPGVCPNRLPVGSSRKTVTIAISGRPGFDVRRIDPGSVRIGREGIKGTIAPVRSMYQDASTPLEGAPCTCQTLAGDGHMDLVLVFDFQKAMNTFKLKQMVGQEVLLTLTGRLRKESGGYQFEGQDCVSIMKVW
ncbi:MAG: hypothetical protein AB1611_19085 [bacterium]